MKIQPSGLCSDEDFLRRIHIDLTGLPPTLEEVDAFIADRSPAAYERFVETTEEKAPAAKTVRAKGKRVVRKTTRARKAA